MYHTNSYILLTISPYHPPTTPPPDGRKVQQGGAGAQAGPHPLLSPVPGGRLRWPPLARTRYINPLKYMNPLRYVNHTILNLSFMLILSLYHLHYPTCLSLTPSWPYLSPPTPPDSPPPSMLDYSMKTMWRFEHMARKASGLWGRNDVIAAWDQVQRHTPPPSRTYLPTLFFFFFFFFFLIPYWIISWCHRCVGPGR